MGLLSRIPPRVRIAMVAVAALLVVVSMGVLGSRNGDSPPVAGATPTFIPTDRDLPANPNAILKKKHLEAAFGVTFRKFQENPIKAQGVQYRFTETSGAFTVYVAEVKGQEAAEAWRRLITDFQPPDAKDMPQTKLQPDLFVAVYKGGIFVSVMLKDGAKPTDGKALHELGKLAHQLIPA